MGNLKESIANMTINSMIGLIFGCLMFASGLGLYIYGTIGNISGVIQASYWLTTSGSLILGIQINLPSK